MKKDMVHKLLAKILSSNQIARFFDHQYLLKESIDGLDFLYDDNYLWKVAIETIIFGWV